MSESLKDRLSSHSNSFEGLLSLIPARYYYNDESNSQWKKSGAASVDEKKAESAANRKNKFDPDVGSSALDEIKRREHAAAEKTTGKQLKKQKPDEDTIETGLDDDSKEDDDNVVVYDDHGNVISGEVEESVEELLRAKTQDPTQAKAEEPRQASKPAATPKRAKKEQKAPNSAKEKVEMPAPKKDTLPSKPEVDEEIADKAEETELRDKVEQLAETDKTQSSKRSKEGIEELRARLTARVNELRAKRRAPGSDGTGAPKNREELLAARKLRLEQKRAQSLKRKAGVEAEEDENSGEDDIHDDKARPEMAAKEPGNTDEDSKLMFGQIEFGDGARLSKDVHSIEEKRKVKKRNAIDQLKVLENRKNKLAKLDKSKQDEVSDNAKWSRAILQSEGAKIRDDEKLLRKTIKQKENRKKRAEKEWKTRIYNVKKGIAGREAKRHANISAHKDAKKLGLKGRKRKEHMKKAAANFKAN